MVARRSFRNRVGHTLLVDSEYSKVRGNVFIFMFMRGQRKIG